MICHQFYTCKKQEFDLGTNYQWVWNQAKSIFHNQMKSSIHSAFSTSIPDEYHIALIAGTLEWPNVYKDFNKATREVRTKSQAEEYRYKSFYKLLLLAVDALSKEPSVAYDDNQGLYRGVDKPLDLPIMGFFSFQHFVSSTTRIEKTAYFGDKIFDIRGNLRNNAIHLKYHSVYKGELEVYINPFVAYQVTWFNSSYYAITAIETYNFPEDEGKCQYIQDGPKCEELVGDDDEGNKKCSFITDEDERNEGGRETKANSILTVVGIALFVGRLA